MSRQAGQASVELCALVPVLAVLAFCGLACARAVRAALAGERAIARAQAALIAGRDPGAAARHALPGARVRITDEAVDLRVRISGASFLISTVHLHRRLAR